MLQRVYMLIRMSQEFHFNRDRKFEACREKMEDNEKGGEKTGEKTGEKSWLRKLPISWME